MAVVKIEIDRERLLKELVRTDNFIERTPPDIVEAHRELTEVNGAINLVKNAPLILEPPPPPPVEEPPVTTVADLDMTKITDWFGTNANTGDITEPFGAGKGIQLSVPNDHEAGSLSGNPRAELLTKGLYTQGDEVWLRTSLVVTGPVPTGWMTLCSFFNAGGNIAPWHLTCVNGQFGWQAPAGNMIWQEPLVKGARYDILHHHRFGTQVEIETWIKVQGKDTEWRLADRRKADTWTSENNQALNYYKNAVYYQKGTAGGQPVVVVFGRTLLGDTRASVDVPITPIEPPVVTPPPPTTGPPGTWKTVVSSAFPTKSPIDWGTDNNPAPRIEGDAIVFHLEPGGERCEAGLNTSNPYRNLKEGQVVLFELEYEFIHLPYTTAGHNTDFQFKGLESGSGSPNFALEPKNGAQGLGLYVAEKGDLHGGGNDTVQFLAPDSEIQGKRVLVQIPFKVSKQRQGYFEIWVNGTKRAEARNVNTLQTISAYGFIKFGTYRAKASSATDIKARNVRIKVPA